MSDKKFMAVIAVLVIAVVGAILVFGGGSSNAFVGDPLKVATGEKPADAKPDDKVQPADMVKGAGKKGVTIIEFGDFECPACYGFYLELDQVLKTYGDDIQFVFRHNPLTSLHPNAFAAHRASVAAANQGKFWEMYDLIYRGQPTWSRQQTGLTTAQAASIFVGYAEQLELDIAKFKTDVDSQETFNYIDSHLDSGRQLDVVGTPTLYINGELVSLRTFAELQQYIDDIIGDSETADTADKASDTKEN